MQGLRRRGARVGGLPLRGLWNVHLHRLRAPGRHALSRVPGEGVGEARSFTAGLMATQVGAPPRLPVDDPPLFRARIAAPIAPMHEEPRVASQQVSQQLAGHDVDAMDMEGDWIRARGADGY